MPQSSIQRTLNKNSGSVIAREHLPCIQNTSTNERIGFFLGSPNLRTQWTIEGIQIEFGVFIKIGESFVEETIEPKYKLEVLIGNIPVAVIRIKVPKLKGKKVSTVIESKLYVLELTTPAAFSKGEPLEFVVLKEENASEPNSIEGQFITVLLTNPLLTINFNITNPNAR